ncbi:MAG TPA: alpha-glucuronidase family glycosyl hydrolase [Bryobacteraceae bacterium]|nr:alpha-glucuronidase family glycosyl hydrolase [Bryobacteraceae bacterium]
MPGCYALFLFLIAGSLWGAGHLTIVTGEAAPPVERYAAEELRRYAGSLFTLKTEIASEPSGVSIILGSPATNPHTARLAGNADWKALRADGFLLKSVDPQTLVIGGIEPRGTLFGVYELLERWGARFTLTEDFLPPRAASFRLPHLHEICRPAYPVRAMRPVNNLPEGSAAWSLRDFERFIDQMAKLKFNTFTLVIMESGPWLDYSFRGVPRPAGDIFYGWRYPITDDFVGRSLFPAQKEYYSPVLAGARNDAERKRAGIGLVRAVQEHARRRGLMTALAFGMLEPPTEFKHRFNEWATLPLPDPKEFAGATFTVTPAEEFGVNPKYAAWMNVMDPAVRELVSLRLNTLLSTYPKTDYYYLWISEHRAGVIDYHKVYQDLDRLYHFPSDFDFEKVLANPGDYAYGRERYQNQVKGDLLFLYLFDEVVLRGGLLGRAARQGSSIGLAGIMPGLAPMAARMLPREHAEFAAWLEYGTHATADQLNHLEPLIRERVPTTLEIGIQDDNTMWFPQVNVESLERIARFTAPRRLEGYVATLWQPRQADLNAAYLGRLSWNPEWSAARFYQDFLPRLMGEAAARPFHDALRVLEAADRDVKKSLYGFAFPFEGVVENKRKGVKRDAVSRIRAQFVQAQNLFASSSAVATPGGRPTVEFWRSRTEFAVRFLDFGVAVAGLGRLLGKETESGAPLPAGQRRQAVQAIDQLLSSARQSIELLAEDVREPGDRGQIASMNRYVMSYLRRLRADVDARVEREP